MCLSFLCNCTADGKNQESWVEPPASFSRQEGGAAAEEEEEESLLEARNLLSAWLKVDKEASVGFYSATALLLCPYLTLFEPICEMSWLS